MSLHLVHSSNEPGSAEDATATVAEVKAVMVELHRFVSECREDPSAMGQLTAADLSHAKTLLASARAALARARRSLF